MIEEAERKYPFVPDGVTVRTVSQVTDEVRALLEKGFATVWLEGEVTNVSRPTSGHVYLTLRDANAGLKSVLYRTQALRLPAGFELRDGVEVVAVGRVSVYAPKGDYQFLIDKMWPKGIGAAELALRQLREKLFKLGYFDPKRKRPLPRFPRSLCLIASATGAAVRDMIEILKQRWPATRVAVRPSRVQGDGAAEEIAAAIEQVNRWKDRRMVQVDAIIIGRGGGSVEDLSAFNHELVAKAIFLSKIPVISAIGHEVDTTLADLVADVRAATPSHAAELVVPHRLEILETVHDLRARMDEAMQRHLDLLGRRLNDLGRRRALRQPVDRLRELERRLDDQGERLKRAVKLRLERGKSDIEARAGKLESLSPLNVLARGYSLTRSGAGLVRSSEQVRPGELIETRLQHGTIISRVETAVPETDDQE
jgi:exodeoxyribonuclease VII large subunit